MTIKDRYFQLKTSIVGTKTSDIDTKLDQAVKDIISYKSKSSQGSYIELIKTLLSKTNEFSLENQGGLFGQGGMTPAAFGQGSRLLRYRTYESIISNIGWCNRALSVLTDNILSPDDITKISLEIKSSSLLEDKELTESKVKNVEEVVKKLKLEYSLTDIIRNTLLFGDYFCEIASTKTALTSRAYLAEDFLNSSNGIDIDKIETNSDKSKILINIDYSALLQEKEESDQKENKKKRKDEEKEDENLKAIRAINNLNLVYHTPGRVLKLQSDSFPLCFGYLIFPKYAVQPHLYMQDQAIDQICTGIIKSLASKLPQMKEFGGEKELKDIVFSMVKQSDYTKSMNIRYVPPNKMQHFKIPTTKYYPYGESVFDSCQFSAKVLIALETALTISRLSRSTEKRKVAVEVGLPRDAQVLVQKLKESLNKRKITLDSFSTIDTIPSLISTFEDIYIPQKDGKPYVDINTFTEGNVDARNKVDELKFMRDSVVSSLGVPAAFLNIEEQINAKATLSEENILFARTVIGHQKYFIPQFNELVEKIYEEIDPELALSILDNVDILLPAPRSLQFEREARMLGDVATLVRTLDEIGIPKEWAKKKYMPNIDWQDLERHGIDEKIEKSLGHTKEEDPMGGMGGMGGAY